MMTKTDFEALAGAIARVRPEDNHAVSYVYWAQFTLSIEDACAASNPRFSRDAFRDACLAGSTGHVAVYQDQDGNRATVNIGPDGLPVQDA